MKCSTLLAASGVCAVASLWLPASANEGITPFLPGVTTGLPLGTLPPPGLYGDSNDYYVSGKIKDGHGNDTPFFVDNFELGISVLWSTPYKILGARYSADFIGLIASPGDDDRAGGGKKTRSVGAFNPIITPLNLSWNISSGVFVAAGQTFYLPDGDTHIVNGARYQTSYANGYFTYEPNIALTYLKNGWDFTANNVVDVNARNSRTHYKSGDCYFVDFTATKKLGDVTLGLIGNATSQFQDDKHDGIKVGDGVRAQHEMIGPLLGYDFGSFSVTARYLRDIRTRDDIAVSIVHLYIAWKF